MAIALRSFAVLLMALAAMSPATQARDGSVFSNSDSTVMAPLPSLRLGARLRATTSDSLLVEGSLLTMTSSLLTLDTVDSLAAIQWKYVATLSELRISKARGVWIGSAVGAALGTGLVISMMTVDFGYPREEELEVHPKSWTAWTPDSCDYSPPQCCRT